MMMDGEEIERPNLGACCACGSTELVLTLMTLPFKAPVPGTGWGCVVCNLPPDGAVAVICARCAAAGEPKITSACAGWPLERGRIAFSEVEKLGPHQHDAEVHRLDEEMDDAEPAAPIGKGRTTVAEPSVETSDDRDHCREWLALAEGRYGESEAREYAFKVARAALDALDARDAALAEGRAAYFGALQIDGKTSINELFEERDMLRSDLAEARAAECSEWQPWPPPADIARDRIDVRGWLRDCGAGYQFDPTHFRALPPSAQER